MQAENINNDFCIDFVNGEFVFFDGYKFSKFGDDKTILFPGKNSSSIITKFVGILHVSSKSIVKSGISKSDMCRKKFTPFNRNFPEIYVKTKKIVPGPDEYAVVKYENVDGNIINCEICEYLGKVGDYKSESKVLQALVTSHWTKKYDKTFQNLSKLDITPIRRDLTNLNVYSIDPEGCEDIDDALSIRKIDDFYEIGIHIADVSSYIEENSVQDIELSNRIETVYLNNKVFNFNTIHMIPEKLSIEHISLKSGKNKRSFSILIKTNSNFEIIEINFVKTIIKVKENLSYEKAQIIIEENKLNTSNDLVMLYNIGEKLKEQISDSFNSVIEYDSHQMVEVFMIIANKLVAEKIQSCDDKHVLLRTQNKTIKINCEKLNDNINEKILNKYIASSLERAKYKLGSEMCDHSGLNLKFYTHFTSPMRRYCDILVHRQLYKIINGESITKIPTKNIFLINYYSKFYKYVQEYSKLIEIINEIDEVTETNAHIIKLPHNAKDQMRIFIPEFDLNLGIKIINKKIEQLFEFETNYEENNQTLKIIKKDTQEFIELSLFQEIKIKMAITMGTIEKINIVLISPDLQKIIDLF